jgi:type II secretory pathway pseudopilin PulG
MEAFTMRESRANRRRSRGLTLIDLAIVLAVMSIIAAVVVPGQVSMLHGQKAEGTARQVTNILDAARRIAFLNAQPTVVEPATLSVFPGAVGATNRASAYVGDDGESPSWPGQRNGNAGQYRCAGSMDFAAAKQVIMTMGNLGKPGGAQEGRVFTNPWGEPLLLSLESPSNGIGNAALPTHPQETNCWFTVSTDVPSDVVAVLKRYLPNGVCNDDPVFPQVCYEDLAYPVPVDYVRCCASVPRPGWEPSTRGWFVDGAGNPLLTSATTAAYCDAWSLFRGGDPQGVDPAILCPIKPQ